MTTAQSRQSEKKARYIYGLCEPDSTSVRYIGQTALSLRVRLAVHMATAARAADRRDGPRVQWLRALRAQGQRPAVILLDIGDEHSWRDLERFHIAAHRSAGFSLLNATPGGETGRRGGKPHAPEQHASERPVWVRRDDGPQWTGALPRYGLLCLAPDEWYVKDRLRAHIRQTVRLRHLLTAWPAEQAMGAGVGLASGWRSRTGAFRQKRPRPLRVTSCSRSKMTARV